MNKTLDKIKALIDQEDQYRAQNKKKRLAKLHLLAEAAEPLFQSYRDLRNQFVRLQVLQEIWPEDYHRRGDTFEALLLGFIEDQGVRYGLRFLVPGGQMAFYVNLGNNGQLVYQVDQDTYASRPVRREYIHQEDWLHYFVRTMTRLIELSAAE